MMKKSADEDLLPVLKEISRIAADDVACEACAWAVQEIEKLRAIRDRLLELDWCIGYELTEEQHVHLDKTRWMAFDTDTRESDSSCDGYPEKVDKLR